jgi:hypothetical protein
VPSSAKKGFYTKVITIPINCSLYSGKKSTLDEKASSAKTKVINNSETGSKKGLEEQWPADTEASQPVSLKKKKSSKEKWTLTYFATNYFSKWIIEAPLKISTLCIAIVLTGIGFYGIVHLKEGLNMQEVVPRNTTAYEFLKAQDAYFGFYHMYAVTQGHFEYPQNQKILYDYHNAFVRVPNIIKDDDGGVNEFWLPLLRNWLVRLQVAFDDDYRYVALNLPLFKKYILLKNFFFKCK